MNHFYMGKLVQIQPSPSHQQHILHIFNTIISSISRIKTYRKRYKLLIMLYIRKYIKNQGMESDVYIKDTTTTSHSWHYKGKVRRNIEIHSSG